MSKKHSNIDSKALSTNSTFDDFPYDESSEDYLEECIRRFVHKLLSPLLCLWLLG
jgi:hypothetical protein